MKVTELANCLKTLALFANETRLQILCVIGKDRLTCKFFSVSKIKSGADEGVENDLNNPTG
jgi:hypothetical protein